MQFWLANEFALKMYDGQNFQKVLSIFFCIDKNSNKCTYYSDVPNIDCTWRVLSAKNEVFIIHKSQHFHDETSTIAQEPHLLNRSLCEHTKHRQARIWQEKLDHGKVHPGPHLTLFSFLLTWDVLFPELTFLASTQSVQMQGISSLVM